VQPRSNLNSQPTVGTGYIWKELHHNLYAIFNIYDNVVLSYKIFYMLLLEFMVVSARVLANFWVRHWVVAHLRFFNSRESFKRGMRGRYFKYRRRLKQGRRRPIWFSNQWRRRRRRIHGDPKRLSKVTSWGKKRTTRLIAEGPYQSKVFSLALTVHHLHMSK
jgi:hypothetical protein